MFLKFRKFFVCFLLLTISYHPCVFAVEGDDQITNDTLLENNEQNKNIKTESSSSEVINDEDFIGDNEFSNEESSKTNESPAILPLSNSFLDTIRQKPIKKRAPVVSASEISKAIDEDYSFLYDPNMKPEIITDMTNNPDNYVIIYLETGDAILIKLKENTAPNTVIRFKKLVKDKFYDDMEIFRAIPDYLIQTGDPSGSGYGGKGVFYFAEINPNEKFTRGSVAMSNNGNLQSDDTQFFITFNSFDWLDGKYTIFGEVILGMNKLENVNKSFANDGFIQEPTIVTKVELLSQRPKDRVDDLSGIIPQEKQKEAIRKQEENKRKEEAKQKFLIENEKQKEALRDAPDLTSDDDEITDVKDVSETNPYLKSRRRG